MGPGQEPRRPPSFTMAALHRDVLRTRRSNSLGTCLSTRPPSGARPGEGAVRSHGPLDLVAASRRARSQGAGMGGRRVPVRYPGPGRALRFVGSKARRRPSGGMRISIVLPNPAKHPVGGFLVSYELANRLACGGAVPTVIHARRMDRPGWRDWRFAGSWLRTGPKRMARWFRFDPRVRLKLLPWLTAAFLPTADVTILTAYETASAIRNRTARSGPLVQIVYDYEFWAAGDPATRRRIEKALRRPDIVHIATSGAVRGMLEEIGVPAVATVPPGIRDHFRCYTPPSERGVIVGFAYREQAHKGMADVLTALRVVHEKYPELAVQCFGRGGAGKLPPWVESLGYLADSEVVEFYNRCAVFVLPSHYEGWGLPAAEAMACGAAVVTTYCGGVEDFAKHEHNALMVRPGDSGALSGDRKSTRLNSSH